MKKGILLILDGYGEGKAGEYNAVKNADSPTLDMLHTLPHSLLKTDGEAVGQFAGEMGGSEVGHTTIGAGRIVPSTSKKIHDDINSGEFFKNEKLLSVAKNLKKNHGNLHLIGLMSDKRVHSDIAHAFALIKLFSSYAKNIFLHLITDGRDSGIHDSLKYLKLVRKEISNYKNCEIASIGGRLYAMDRENNLDRTKIGMDAMFSQGGLKSDEVEKYIISQHKINNTDQYIVPTHVQTKESSAVTKNDCLFFFNFREDRLRQIVKMCEGLGCALVTMAEVGGTSATPIYTHKNVEGTLSEYLSKLGLKQIKISESTKYAHVTYFLNGGREEPFKGEDRVHVPSLKVERFNETPKMRAKEITDQVLKAIDKKYDAIIVNFSNPDMIGHTGDYEATKKAIEYLDICVKKVLEKAKKKDYFVLITADHGNSETMRTPSGEPHMAHTTNRVLCVVVDNIEHKMARYGGLKDVAPTMLDLMQVEPNPKFEGKTLIVHNK